MKNYYYASFESPGEGRLIKYFHLRLRMGIKKTSLYIKKSCRNKKKFFFKHQTFNEITFKVVLIGIAFVVGICLYRAVFRTSRKIDYAPIPISAHNEDYYLRSDGGNVEQLNGNLEENEIKDNEIDELHQANSCVNNELKSKTNIVPNEINLPEMPQSVPESSEVLHEKIQELPTTLQQEEDNDNNECDGEEGNDDDECECEEDNDVCDHSQSNQEKEEDKKDDGNNECEAEHQTSTELAIEHVINHALPVNEEVINTETTGVENLNSNPSNDSNNSVLVLDPIEIEPAKQEQDTIKNQCQSGINIGDRIIEEEPQPAIAKFIEDPLVFDELVDSGNYFKAIEMNYSVALSKIIDSGVDISALNENGLNALHYATSLLNVEMMKILIDTKKFDLDAVTQDKALATALMLICTNDIQSEKILEAATLLITSGANVDLVDSANFTPLASAVDGSKYELIEYLLKSGADVNAKIRDHNTTALHRAMLTCDRKVLKILIDNKANINEVNGRNMAPIHTAAYAGCVSGLRELILTRRVDKNFKSPKLKEGKCMKKYTNGLGCMFQATPLHYAADSNRFEAVKFLLLIQADLHATDQYNRSSLYRAREAGHKEIRNYLDKRFDWEMANLKWQDVEKLIRENEKRPISENNRLDQFLQKLYLQHIKKKNSLYIFRYYLFSI